MQDKCPADDVLELSLFGPGIGECIVVHLGCGDWMVVDSCLGEDRETPVARQYLESIGVNLETQVKLIVITHWHADHIAGASKLVSQCKNAEVALSGAWFNEAFFELVISAQCPTHVKRHSPSAEIWAIFERLRDRGNPGGHPDHWATHGNVLFNEAHAQVFALSPMAATVTAAELDLRKQTPVEGESILTPPPVHPNAHSVALLIKKGNHAVLLGADLPSDGPSERGWDAVIDSRVRPRVSANAFKVAHHGSGNGDTPRIWSELLASDPIAFVAPYATGRKKLPSADDVNRIRESSAALYCTSCPGHRKAVRRHSSVERTIKEMGVTIRQLTKSDSQIRWRLSEDGRHETELISGAKQL